MAAAARAQRLSESRCKSHPNDEMEAMIPARTAEGENCANATYPQTGSRTKILMYLLGKRKTSKNLVQDSAIRLIWIPETARI